MATRQTPQQVAKRALILGAIAFRASLEAAPQPQANELSSRLLPWLGEIGCGDGVDPIEQELLAMPLGELSASQRTDVNWAGEAAAIFCWMLDLAVPLRPAIPEDQPDLSHVLPILRPAAAEILRSASLRDIAEIEDVCRQFVLVRSILQELRVGPPASDIIRRLNVDKLDDVGLAVTDDAISRASEAIHKMTPPERQRAAGAYFVRQHAALWFLIGRSRYFG